MAETHIIVPGVCKGTLQDHPMLLRGELSESPGYQISFSDDPQNMHIFWIRIHVNVFFLCWCIFPCSIIKQEPYKYHCEICYAWKCLCKDGPWAYCLQLLGDRLCQKDDVNSSSFDLQKKH